MLERESFKLVLACFLKLSFFCVFVGDFCSPPRSSGLAPNKGHEKRWHLGMASLVGGRAGHGAISPWRHNRLPAGGTGPLAQGSWAGWGPAGSCRRQGDIRSKAGERKLPREVSLECIMHLSGLSAFVGPRGNKLAHDCWWCVHICVGVCGMLRTFYGSRLTATFIKRECG